MPFAHSETAEHVRATFGAVLRRRREAGEWSLADIAGSAGISIGHLSEVERGRKDISTDRLVDLARALDTTVGELYAEVGRELGAGGAPRALARGPDPPGPRRRGGAGLATDPLPAGARLPPRPA